MATQPTSGSSSRLRQRRVSPWVGAIGFGVLLGIAGTIWWGPARPPAPAANRVSGNLAELGPDTAAIGNIRITVKTGVVNGAGTLKPILAWFDNQPFVLSRDAQQDFAPGVQTSAVLSGPGLPRTLGALRAASILLTVQLDRAEMGVSWYCDSASVEVRLEGSDDYRLYLSDTGVGWLSQDEPPRRSTAYALQ